MKKTKKTQSKLNELQKLQKLSHQDPTVKEHEKKVFVAGFHHFTKEQDLRQLFSQFGQIVKIVMNFNGVKIARGYCIIKFIDKETALRVSKLKDLSLNGRRLVCELVLKGEKLRKFEEMRDRKRIFISNIPKTVDEQLLRRLLLKHTRLVENLYIVDKPDGKMTSIGYAELKDEQAVGNLMKKRLVIHSNRIYIRKYKRRKKILEERSNLRERKNPKWYKESERKFTASDWRRSDAMQPVYPRGPHGRNFEGRGPSFFDRFPELWDTYCYFVSNNERLQHNLHFAESPYPRPNLPHFFDSRHFRRISPLDHDSFYEQHLESRKYQFSQFLAFLARNHRFKPSSKRYHIFHSMNTIFWNRFFAWRRIDQNLVLNK
jgi:RNA recognition motif-containing protein